MVYILLSSLAARIFLFPVEGCLGDLAAFASWFKAAAEHGPFVFYHIANCDYPPLNVYIFWAFGSLAKSLSLFGSPALVYILKLPSTLFDTATASMIFIFLRKRLSFDSSLLATSFYAFNPATILNGSIWGQFDAIYTFFLIASLILILYWRPKLSIMAFTVAVLAKPQSIALAPLLVFLLVRKKSWKTVASSVLTSMALILIVSGPVSLNNPSDFLVNIYLKGYQSYPYTSANAFNLWAVGGLWKSDAQTFLSLDFFKIGWILFGALTAFSLCNLYKTFHRTDKNNHTSEVTMLFTAFVLLFGFFMLPTRIHERYLFPVFGVLAIVLPFVKEGRPLYGVLTFTYFANLAYVLPVLNAGSRIPDWDPVVYVITAVNLATFVYALIVMIKKLKVSEHRCTDGQGGI